MRQLDRFADLETLAASEPALYVRYSQGPDMDAAGGSIDTESQLQMPGLSVNPLTPESWWTRPLGDWIARQLCQYKHLQEKNPERFAWVLHGRHAGWGPDCEPLLVDVEQIARLSPALLAAAEQRYRENFNAGHGLEDD